MPENRPLPPRSLLDLMVPTDEQLRNIARNAPRRSAADQAKIDQMSSTDWYEYAKRQAEAQRFVPNVRINPQAWDAWLQSLKPSTNVEIRPMPQGTVYDPSKYPNEWPYK
jgi:hypothetical protein